MYFIIGLTISGHWIGQHLAGSNLRKGVHGEQSKAQRFFLDLCGHCAGPAYLWLHSRQMVPQEFALALDGNTFCFRCSRDRGLWCWRIAGRSIRCSHCLSLPPWYRNRRRISCWICRCCRSIRRNETGYTKHLVCDVHKRGH